MPTAVSETTVDRFSSYSQKAPPVFKLKQSRQIPALPSSQLVLSSVIYFQFSSPTVFAASARLVSMFLRTSFASISPWQNATIS